MFSLGSQGVNSKPTDPGPEQVKFRSDIGDKKGYTFDQKCKLHEDNQLRKLNE